MDRATLEQIGARIAERRKQLSFTQENLAEQMGVSVQMVSNLERGNKAVKIDNLIKLSGILGVSTDYILTGKLSEAETNSAAEKLSRLSGREQKAVQALIDNLAD